MIICPKAPLKSFRLKIWNPHEISGIDLGDPGVEARELLVCQTSVLEMLVHQVAQTHFFVAEHGRAFLS
jgi:hypothetical protein